MERKQFNLIGLGLVAIMLFGHILGPVLTMTFPTIFSGMLGNMLGSYIGIYIFGVGILLFLIRKIPRKAATDKQPIKISKFISLLLFTYGFSTVVTLLYNLLFLLLGLGQGNVVGATVSQMNLIQNMLVVVILAPVLEEFLFRNLLYQLIAPYGKIPYIVFSSLAFGLFHANISQIIYAAAMGAVLAYIMWETKNILYPIIFHIAHNFIGGFLTLSIGTTDIGGVIILVLMLLSIMVLLVMTILAIKKGQVKKVLADLKATSFKPLFLNFGMLLYIIICISLAVFILIVQVK